MDPHGHLKNLDTTKECTCGIKRHRDRHYYIFSVFSFKHWSFSGQRAEAELWATGSQACLPPFLTLTLTLTLLSIA